MLLWIPGRLGLVGFTILKSMPNPPHSTCKRGNSQETKVPASLKFLTCSEQGSFAECASPAPVTAELARLIFELLRAEQVHNHPQVFVRRSALLAAAQVMNPFKVMTD